jgi:TP901 family phage tail tape measure protein
MADLAELELRIKSLEVETAKRRLDALSRSGATAEKTATRMERGFDKTSKSAGLLGRTLRDAKTQVAALFGVLAAARAVSGAVRSITNFQETMATVGAVAIRTTSSLETQEKQMQSLTDTAKNLGATTRFTATQAAEGLLFLSRAGFTVEESIAALPSTLDLATAGVLGLGEAADIASNVLRQFSLAATETERVVDALVVTSNRSNTNVQQLAEALKLVGPIAGSTGRSVEEMTAAIGALGNAGIQASLAGTGLRGIFASLLGPTGIAEKAILDLGLSLEEVNPATNDLADVFERFASKGLTAETALRIFSRRQVAAALVLRDSTKEMRDLTEAQEESAGAARAQAKAMDDNLGGSFRALRSAVEALSLSIGDAGFAGSLRFIVDLSTDVIRQLAGVQSEIKTNVLLVNLLASSIEGLTAAVKALIAIGVARFLIGIGTAIKGMTALFGASTIIVAKLFTLIRAHPLLSLASAIGAAFGAFKFFTRETRVSASSVADFADTLRGASRAVNFFEGELDKQAEKAQEVRDEILQLEAVIARGASGGFGKIRLAIAEGEDLPNLNRQFQELRDRLKELERESAKARERLEFKTFTANLEAANKQFEASRGILSENERQINFITVAISEYDRRAKALSKQLVELERDIRATGDASLSELQKQKRLSEELGTNIKIRKLLSVELVKQREEQEKTTEVEESRLDALLGRLIQERELIGKNAIQTAELTARREAENIAKEDSIIGEDALIDRIAKEAAENERLAQSIDEATRKREANANAVTELEGLLATIRDEREAIGLDEVALARLNARREAMAMATAEQTEKQKELIAEVIKEAARNVELAQTLDDIERRATGVESLQERLNNLRFEGTLIGKTSVEVARLTAEREALNTATAAGLPAGTQLVQLIGQEAEQNEKLRERLAALDQKRKENRQAIEEGARFLSSTFAGAFSDILLGIEKIEDAFRNLFQTIIRQALNNSLANAFQTILGGLTGSQGAGGTIARSFFGILGAGAAAGAAQPTTPTVTTLPAGAGIGGGQFGFQEPTSFAAGGIAGRILEGPAFFGLSGGRRLGVAGEAGPEVAFAPLMKGPTGRMGVEAVAPPSSSSPSIVNQYDVKMFISTPSPSAFNASKRQTVEGFRNELQGLR